MIDFQHIVKSFTGIDATWQEIEISASPKRFIVRRVRAEIVSNDGWAETIAIAISEKSMITAGSIVIDTILGYTPIILQYDPIIAPIDTLEYIYFESQEAHVSNTELGSIYIAIKLDTDPPAGQSGSSAKAVVSLDIEVLH